MTTVTLSPEQVIDIIDSLNERIESIYHLNRIEETYDLPGNDDDNDNVDEQAKALQDIINLLQGNE